MQPTNERPAPIPGPTYPQRMARYMHLKTTLEHALNVANSGRIAADFMITEDLLRAAEFLIDQALVQVRDLSGEDQPDANDVPF